MSYRFYGCETADIVDERGLTPRDYYDLLSDIWSKETCAPRMRQRWTPENKTVGQCSITSFLLQDIYGGKVLGIPLGDGNYHCFNVVDDCVFDLTSEQFGERVLDYEYSDIRETPTFRRTGTPCRGRRAGCAQTLRQCRHPRLLLRCRRRGCRHFL